MAFTNRVLLIVPGFGTPIQNDTLFLKQTNAVAIGSTTVSLAGLTPAIKQGWIRLKFYNAAAGGTVTSYVITVTDGTTTENEWSETLVATNNSFVSPNQVVRTIPMLSELAVTQVNVIAVVATGAGSLDVEVGAGN